MSARPAPSSASLPPLAASQVQAPLLSGEPSTYPTTTTSTTTTAKASKTTKTAKTPRPATPSNIAAAASVTAPAQPRRAFNVALGHLIFDAWYKSSYPAELLEAAGKASSPADLYVCRWCFRYSTELVPYIGHMNFCPLRDCPPPGKKVCDKGHYSVYEVDGELEKLYCQNASLFGKLFLDSKSICFDVEGFSFFFLVDHSTATELAHGGGRGAGQAVGFFSKEKMSWDNNNLACIVVFPPWQRQGLGRLLMTVSYELSRAEGCMGGPERPLSTLGRRGYMSFWCASVAQFILARSPREPLTVQAISDGTYILPGDVIAALKEMRVLTRAPPVVPATAAATAATAASTVVADSEVEEEQRHTKGKKRRRVEEEEEEEEEDGDVQQQQQPQQGGRSSAKRKRPAVMMPMTTTATTTSAAMTGATITGTTTPPAPLPPLPLSRSSKTLVLNLARVRRWVRLNNASAAPPAQATGRRARGTREKRRKL